MTLSDFLEHKPLYYKKFDPLRMKNAYLSIKAQLHLPKIIHLIGTNGKGSTGRYLAQMLHFCDQKVGHYTSPHILHFNERIWLNGEVAEDALLEEAFRSLCEILDPAFQESLSYFEFTTLLAMTLFQSCDYVVLEAGLGGEHDATAVFENCLTLVTPIGLDHADFLGDTIEQVALTKIKAVQKKAITAHQEPAVMQVLKEESKARGFKLLEVTLTQEDQAIVEHFKATGTADYLVCNYKHALAAFRDLGFKNSLAEFKPQTLFGRLTAITPLVTIDVGHNVLAAEKILEHYRNRKVNLVYNTLADKKYEEILALLKPIIEKVFIINIVDDRALEKTLLQTALEKLSIEYAPFETIEADCEYLVFGSFVVVETFLKRYHAVYG